MSAPAQSRLAAAPARLASWGRQAIESYVAAQQIVLDLTAQQNALVIGMLRERVIKPRFRPSAAIAHFTDQSVTSLTEAGKILLDLAAGETSLVANSLKNGLRLNTPAGAAADVVHQRIESFIEMQKLVLETAAEQTHTAIESYKAGKGINALSNVAELTRKSLEGVVETEKKFLDFVSEQVTVATENRPGTTEPPEDRVKILLQFAQDGVEKFIDAQKKLLSLAVDTLESYEQGPEEEAEKVEKEPEEPRTSFAEATQKSVQNFITAQKSLLDLVVKPRVVEAQAEGAAATPRRQRRKK